MSGNLPASGRQVRSTLGADGTLVIDMAEVPVVPPGPGEVVVAVEAAPVNPSDIITLLASADARSAHYEPGRVSLQVPAAALPSRKGRFGLPLAVGITGAGTVIAAGTGAPFPVGARVTLLSLDRGMFGEFVTVPAATCAPLPEGVACAQAADVFCNPMTVMAMIEEVRLAGQHSLIHTAAASNVGQMLVRACREHGVALVNVVRRPEQAERLREIGAEHVVVSSAPDFFEALRDAISCTGARIAFDAIGGGTMADTLHRAMESVDAGRMEGYSPYGSYEPKVVHIYGYLDTSPTLLSSGDYGTAWAVDIWNMQTALGRVSASRRAEIMQAIFHRLHTDFASHFAHVIGLDRLLDRGTLTGIARMATGGKYLVDPRL